MIVSYVALIKYNYWSYFAAYNPRDAVSMSITTACHLHYCESLYVLSWQDNICLSTN